MRMGMLVDVIVAVDMHMLMSVHDAVVGMLVGVHMAVAMSVAMAMKVTVVHVPKLLGDNKTDNFIIARHRRRPKFR